MSVATRSPPTHVEARDCLCGHRRNQHRVYASRRGGCRQCRCARYRLTEPKVHGSPSTYSNHGCRCQPCREAATKAVADNRRARFGATPPVHNNNGYTNYGCRCPECRADHSAVRRQQRIDREAGTDQAGQS